MCGAWYGFYAIPAHVFGSFAVGLLVCALSAAMVSCVARNEAAALSRAAAAAAAGGVL